MNGLKLSMLGIVALSSSCRSSGPGFRVPEFSAPRDGVWNAPYPLIEGTGDELMGVVSDDGWLIYAEQSGGGLDIFRRPFSGGSARRLTDHPGDDRDPRLSPDGRTIAYTSQSADVKGDIWVMDLDGSDREALTDRSSADGAPCWSPSGNAIYFTSSIHGGRERIERLDLERQTRSVIVQDAWDPALSPDGDILFFTALDSRRQPRLFALRFSDKLRVPLTDGVYPEGFPRAIPSPEGFAVVFVRFTDDANGDHELDSKDPASLWRAEFEPSVFEDREPADVSPLTGGNQSGLFPAVIADFLVYTTSGLGNLDLYALPLEGQVSAQATHRAVFEAARSEPEVGLRRLGLRYVIANSSELEAEAHYRLARDMAEQGEWAGARAEFHRAEHRFGDDPRGLVAAIEGIRLDMLESLNGSLWPRGRRQVDAVSQILRRLSRPRFAVQDRRVQARLELTRTEARLALGEFTDAIARLERLSKDTDAPREDRARALDRLTDGYGQLNDNTNLARLCEVLLRELSTERFYARRCAERWVATARNPAGAPNGPDRSDQRNALGVSIAGALRGLAERYSELPMLAARAYTELAITQSEAGYEDAARGVWKRITEDYPDQPEIVAEALLALARSAERGEEYDVALKIYENLLARFSEDLSLRTHARRGISRITLVRARREEDEGQIEAAIRDYREIIANDRTLVEAHRSYIRLSVDQGRHVDVVAEYREAARREPLDRFSRYGFAYALTFGDDPDLDVAEAELTAALEIDPRLAPAHLTLGWIRLQREHRNPREGWAEQAVSSFGVAEQLIDRDGEVSLYAAVRLNIGNAFFALNKLDDAFLAFLDRELAEVPFRDPATELIFRERFARTALREDHLDVALDQARLAYRRVEELAGRPRHATLAALIGSVYFLVEDYGSAIPWLTDAQGEFRRARDWQRTIPLLRTLSLAEWRRGDFDAARHHIEELEALLDDDRGPKDPSRPFFNGYEFQIWSETAAKANDVTLGAYGFSARLEHQFTKALYARMLVDHGQVEKAKGYMEARVRLLRRFYGDGVRGKRALPELVVALNEAGILAARSGAPEDAVSYWREAVDASFAAENPEAIAMLGESLLTLWIDEPQLRDSELVERIRVGLAESPKGAVGLAAQTTVTRVRALYELDGYLRSGLRIADDHEGAQSGVPKRFRDRLAALDVVARAANAVDPAGAEVSETRVTETGSGTAPVAASDPRGDTGTVPVLALAGRRRVKPWRVAYARATGDRTALAEAADLYLVDPTPSAAPELEGFLTEAEGALVAAGELERAWRLREHTRLLELQPPRVRGERSLPAAWLALVDRRATENYDPNRQSALIRALEGVAVGRGELAPVLGDDAVLIQRFSRGSSWIWYATDSENLEHFQTDTADALPSTLAAWLNDRPERQTLYVDVGNASLEDIRLGDDPLTEYFDVSEVLSATYLLAAYETRTIASGNARTLNARTLNDFLVDREMDASFVRFSSSIEFYGSYVRSGEGQLVFRDEQGVEWLDLEKLAGLRLRNRFWIVNAAPQSPRAARLLARTALLSGTPTVLLVNDENALDDSATKALAGGRRIVRAARRLKPSPRVLGFCGMNLNERVFFAHDRLLTSVAGATKAYSRAKTSDDVSDWRDARSSFRALLSYIDYLVEPSHRRILAASSDPVIAKRADSLVSFQLRFKQQYARILEALGALENVIELRQHLASAWESSGEIDKAIGQQRRVAVALAESDKNVRARAAFEQCIALASEEGKSAIEADCRSRLGSVLRKLYLHEEAKVQYERSIALYAEIDHPALWAPARYLGFLYENAFNDYDAALTRFEESIQAARRFEKAKKRLPGLYLDRARIYRLRGEFERALSSVQRAQGLSAPTDRVALTNAYLEEAKIFWYRGSYRRGRRAQEQALKLSLESGELFQRIQALSVGSLIAMNQGDLDEALELSRSALELSRITRRRSEEAAQLNNLGVILQRRQSIDAAISAFSSALKIDERLNSREGRAFDLRNLATALSLKGGHDEALRTLDEALRLSREIGIPFNELQCLFRRGEVLSRLKRDDEARHMYEIAEELAERIAVPELQWRSLFALGRLEREQGDRDAARRFFDQALEVAERLGRNRTAGDGSAERDDLYEEAITLAADANDLTNLFALLERRQGRARLDAFSSRLPELADADATRLLRDVFRARDRWLAERRARRQGRSDDGGEYSLRSYRALQRELEERFPRIAYALTLNPVTMEDLQRRLPRDTAVVSYYIGVDTSLALILTPDSACSVELALKRAQARQMSSAIKRQMRAFGFMDDELVRATSLLIEPIRKQLDVASQVIIVPDPSLASIPFAALPVDDEMMLDRVVLSEVGTASTLALLLQTSRPGVTKRVASFAFGEDLPFAVLEASAVAEVSFVGLDATIDELRNNRADAWDIAVHTELNANDLLASSLRMAPATDGRRGRLKARDIFTFAYVPSLVTLSGCETGVGAADESARLSLADVFFAAGADTVIATRHRVSDFAAARMMKWFYRYRTEHSSSEALRLAMKRVRADSPHPAFWATFTLIGDYR